MWRCTAGQTRKEVTVVSLLSARCKGNGHLPTLKKQPFIRRFSAYTLLVFTTSPSESQATTGAPGLTTYICQDEILHAGVGDKPNHTNPSVYLLGGYRYL